MNAPAATLRGRKTSAQVLRTALHLFTREGFFNTSIHDIQRAAGVSIGSIYHHFGSKEQIAKALYDMVLGEMNQLVNDAMARHQGAEQRCQAIIASMLQATEDDPEIMQFVLYARHRELIPDSPPICSSRPFRLIRDIVQQGMDQGEIRPMDAWIAASVLFGGAIRMIQLRLDGMLQQPLPELADELWKASWRAVASG